MYFRDMSRYYREWISMPFLPISWTVLRFFRAPNRFSFLFRYRVSIISFNPFPRLFDYLLNLKFNSGKEVLPGRRSAHAL